MSEYPPQPDVEEVGQVGVANIVVIRRIGSDELPTRALPCVELLCFRCDNPRWQPLQNSGRCLSRNAEVTRRMGEAILLSIIPDHRECLPRKRRSAGSRPVA